MDKKGLGNFIASKRKEQHMTQKDLADHLIVTTTAISKWERGVNLPDIELWEKIAEVLHVTFHDLLNHSNIPQQMISSEYLSFDKNKPLAGEVIFGGNIIPPKLLYWSEELNGRTYVGSLRLRTFNYSITDNSTFSYYEGGSFSD